MKNLVRFGAVGRLVDRILCVGPEIRDKAIARLAPAGRTQLFANAIDVTRFRPREGRDRALARAWLDLPDKTPTLLIFAWNWNVKGGSLLLEAVRELRSQGRDVLAVVVGSEAECRAEAKRLELESSIRSVAPIDDPRVLYAAADIFVAPSSAEGMPWAVLEALSCGIPVIASEISAHQYLGRSLPACRVVPLSTLTFSNAIATELDAAPGPRRVRLQESRTQIEREYSLGQWSTRLIDMYEQLLLGR
ncbi:MAG: glycosyltransferase family 4 protein [Solirubrobacterales bacterium]|nr:glycosyltransferase family 4 protein [Solirubrobacterales bacterium]